MNLTREVKDWMHTENSKILLTVIKENLSKWKDIPCLFDRNRKSSPQTHVCVLSHFSHVRLCNHIDCSWSGSSVHGILQARILEWVGCPPPGDLPNPGIEPRSPALQANSSPAEPQGKPTITIWPSNSRRRQWHLTPVLLPGKSQGQRSLVGCSPWSY